MEPRSVSPPYISRFEIGLLTSGINLACLQKFSVCVAELIPRRKRIPTNIVWLPGTNIVIGLAYCVSSPPPTTAPVAPGTMCVRLSRTLIRVPYRPKRTARLAATRITQSSTIFKYQLICGDSLGLLYSSRSGDTCAVMETQFGITFDQIRQWNPEVDANCTSSNYLVLSDII